MPHNATVSSYMGTYLYNIIGIVFNSVTLMQRCADLGNIDSP